MIIREDVQRVVAETGGAENDEGVGGSVGEGGMKEVEGEVDKWKTQLKEKEDADSGADTSGRPE